MLSWASSGPFRFEKWRTSAESCPVGDIRIEPADGDEMAVPDRSSVRWNVLYAVVGLGAVASLALLLFATAPVLPWAAGIITLGLPA